MSVKIYAIIAVISLILASAIGAKIYFSGFDAGKKNSETVQIKHKKQMEKRDVKIDKQTPFNADRVNQLEWLRGQATRQ